MEPGPFGLPGELLHHLAVREPRSTAFVDCDRVGRHRVSLRTSQMLPGPRERCALAKLIHHTGPGIGISNRAEARSKVHSLFSVSVTAFP